MKKSNIITIIILVLCFVIVGCGAQNNTIKDIKAEEFLISYEMAYYDSKDKIDQESLDLLVENYNNLEINGMTNTEINYDKAISIIFYYDDQISGQITMDEKGVCHLGDVNENYNYSVKNNIYDEALKVFKELEAKYQ